jgi:hypothetical protein
MIDNELKQVLIHDSRDEDDTSESKDDERSEMPWTSKQEAYVIRIKNECSELQNEHNVLAHNHKRKYILFSIPSIVLPLLLSTTNELLTGNYSYISTIGMMTTGIVSGLNTFFNHGKRYENHNNFAGKYEELAGEIESTLAKNKRYRTQCDVYMETIKNKYAQLNASAPMI